MRDMAAKNPLSDSLMSHQNRPVEVDASITQQHLAVPQLYCDMPVVAPPKNLVAATTGMPGPSPGIPPAPSAPAGPAPTQAPGGGADPNADRKAFSQAITEAFQRAGFQVSRKSMFTFGISNGARSEIVDTETVYYMWRNNASSGQDVIEGFVKRKLNDFSR